MSAKVLTKAAAKEAKIELIENGRGTQAVHDAVVAMRAARRSGSANTKTKAEVDLSGAKPWRQKGTGRARAGYKSSPIWRGGGVVFGPKPRDYSKKVSKIGAPTRVPKGAERADQRRRRADGRQVRVTEVENESVRQLGQEADRARRRFCIVSDSFDENTYRSARNVKPVQLATASDVNTEQLLAFEKILVTDKALAKLAERTAASGRLQRDKNERAITILFRRVADGEGVAPEREAEQIRFSRPPAREQDSDQAGDRELFQKKVWP